MLEKPTIETFNLSKSYGSTIGIDDVSLIFPSGSVGLLGPNGAGKTTLIRTLLGIIKPTKGTAQVLGYDIRSEIDQVRDKMGYMPEYIHEYVPDAHAMKFITFAGKLGGLSSNDAKQRASDTLYYVGLEEERYREIKSFSLGMKAKLKLALALVHDPDILILDEPTNGLDPKGRLQMLKLIRLLQQDEGKDIVLSSHLLFDVERTCDHVMVLNQGKLLAQGKLNELTGRNQNIIDVRTKTQPGKLVTALQNRGLDARIAREKHKSLVRVTNDKEITDKALETQIFEAAYESNLEIRSIGSKATNLEEVFLQLFNNKKQLDGEFDE